MDVRELHRLKGKERSLLKKKEKGKATCDRFEKSYQVANKKKSRIKIRKER